jgi:hypothetical protein
MTSERDRKLGRRQFIRGIGVGAAATAAMPLSREAAADSKSNDEKRKTQYKESDHVKAYYRVNRYPGSK